MNEINKMNLSEQTKFRLSKIIGIENYFHQEINQRKSCSKKLSKYVTAFDYIDKILIVFSTATSLYHFVCKRCWSTTWNSKCKFYFNFFSNNSNNPKIIRHNKKQKEKSLIRFLCWLKVNSIALKL